MLAVVALASLLTPAHAKDGASKNEVHVAALVGAGVAHNGAAYTVASEDVLDGAALGSAGKVAPGGAAEGSLGSLLMPMGLDVRLHWGRVMVAAGMDWSLVATSGVRMLEYKADPGPPDINRQSDTIGSTFDDAIYSRTWWLQAGGVLGQDAALGFGPRLGARWGWTNLSRGQQVLADVGWAFQPPVLESIDPIRPVVDAALFGGVSLPASDSIALEASNDGKTMFPVVGLDLSVGLMF